MYILHNNTAIAYQQVGVKHYQPSEIQTLVCKERWTTAIFYGKVKKNQNNHHNANLTPSQFQEGERTEKIYLSVSVIKISFVALLWLPLAQRKRIGQSFRTVQQSSSLQKWFQLLWHHFSLQIPQRQETAKYRLHAEPDIQMPPTLLLPHNLLLRPVRLSCLLSNSWGTTPQRACGQCNHKGLKNCYDLYYWCACNLNTIYLCKVIARANWISDLSLHFSSLW